MRDVESCDWRARIDWPDLLEWLRAVDVTQKRLDAEINPRFDAELATVEAARAEYRSALVTADREDELVAIARRATDGMHALLTAYLVTLLETREALVVFEPWRRYHAQLSRLSLDTPELQNLVGWLGPFGCYVESEQAYVDGEIAKVADGAYLDFLPAT